MLPYVHFLTLLGLTLAPQASSTFTPVGAIAQLTGPNHVFGSFRFSTQADSEDIKLVISMSGLLQYNQSSGLAYHIHEKPITSDGDCSSALGHFKVWNTKPSCYSDNLQWCQPAEFPLRHGNLPGLVDQFTLRFNDSAISLSGMDSIIGRSLVVHGANFTRLACGNIVSWVPANTVWREKNVDNDVKLK